MTIDIENYLRDLSEVMEAKSSAVRRDFKNHSPSSGEKGERIVFDFLKNHLPKKFNISLNSFAISSENKTSNEIDILISDSLNNSPYYSSSSNRREYWPIESIYAAIEVKTNLTGKELNKAIESCRKFKKLNKKFCEGTNPRIKDSLFCIWAFESNPKKQNNFVKNLSEKLKNIPIEECPDFIFVQNKFVVTGGSYVFLVKFGDESSSHREKLKNTHGIEKIKNQINSYKITNYTGDKNPLIPFYFWLDSWLRRAGDRVSDPMDYLKEE